MSILRGELDNTQYQYLEGGKTILLQILSGKSLREGGIFCAAHNMPPEKHCACCGETETELRPDEGMRPRWFSQYKYGVL